MSQVRQHTLRNVERAVCVLVGHGHVLGERGGVTLSAV